MTLAGLTVNETELDGLLSALELLKRCGGKTEDERQIWCLDWLRTTTRMTTSKISASNAKAALTRMKALKKVMDILSGSLANAIMQVTETTAHVVRAVGFSSLPDDVIARVFELYHEEMHHSNMSGDIIHSPQHLASICTRFRRIALHLPHLWEDVSSLSSQDWISCLQGRSQTSEVFINQYYGTSKTVEEALQQIRPTNEWKGLHIYYQGAKSGRKIFQRWRCSRYSGVESPSIAVGSTCTRPPTPTYLSNLWREI
ncbi:hypothetical protein SCHPADRAFT_625052 [Schizopora paradoxa]|uniref:F-box domain-containing protein n=1 Tax=Schizopora paradoxa TaxID=27342 RepID=A0A0H2R860_9AGAM|nr:hypothetical protein SCHPADRAFT_625052 [Schizopora paradoxa]